MMVKHKQGDTLLKLQLEARQYENPVNMCLRIFRWSPVGDDGRGVWEVFRTLTVNPDHELGDQFFAVDNREQTGIALLESLEQNGVIKRVSTETVKLSDGKSVPLYQLTQLGRTVVESPTYTKNPASFSGVTIG